MRISDWSSDVCSSDLINGIARLLAQTPEQLSPSIERAGENMLQITIRRGEIGLPQQSIKRREQISLAKRAAEMNPEAHALLARRPVLQIVLRPAEQRGYEQVGKVKVIMGLQRKAERRQQVTHGKRSEEHTYEHQELM